MEPVNREYSGGHCDTVLPIKAVLCDQRLIGGVGNAYADEILWEAQIRPRRSASLMTADEVARLHAAVRRVLAEATDHLRRIVGSRVRGEPRRDFFRVHHRSRKPCPRCGAAIAFESLRDRPTNWCPACQADAGGGRSRPAC
jgi:formamidopyrimidine-DNA glycosylase